MKNETPRRPPSSGCLKIAAIVFLAQSPLNTAKAEPTPLVDVGVARVDITPDYPVRLSGYLSRKTESVGIAQRIFAKALAIGSDEQGPVLLVSVDNLGVGEDVVEQVLRRLQNKIKLPRANFCVASSHTHSAPCTTNVAPNLFGHKLSGEQQAAIDRYTKELTDNLERVCFDALKARKPGRLAWAQGKVAFAMNRRTKGGPVDHSLPALRVTDPDGALRAVLVNYACHCTTLNPEINTISGDWAGFAQAAIEADHPGAIALTVIGCGADANPMRRIEPTAAAEHGRALADEINRLLKGAWVPLSGPPQTAFERFALPFDTLPTRAELEDLIKKGGAPGYNASVQLAKLDRGEPLQSQLNYSAQAWRFGDDLLMVFLPGEVVVDYVLRLKKEYDPARLWVTAYANDDPCYIPSERILREGGYEGGGAMMYYNRPTRLKPGVEQIIMDAVHRVVGDRFKAVNADDAMPPPLSPREALATLHTRAGLRVETVVAEPFVQSPVAVDFGAEGAVWVAEMRDYPTGIDGNWKPGGVIRKLEDRDHDGTYETATVFAKDLPFPTGVMAWRKGVLICAAPDILYAEDTNGDGVADKTHVLFHGFATENYQARVNGLSYGIDNWVYGANGLIGGTIHGTASGKDVNIGGRDFRIKPDTGAMEPASGLSQQGRIHDDWGNQFGGNNSILIQHYPLPDHYSRRNPRVAAPTPSVILDGNSSQLYPASRTLARFNHPESANRVTSACGPAIYRDLLLGAEYMGDAFTCEPVHNLVRRTVLREEGATFTGWPDIAGSAEFLRSTDPWFRPVQAKTAPDGSLWVVDMYRAVIEHPRWISPEKLATLDVRAGADRGRIYRVVPEKRPLWPAPILSSLTTPELAAAIDSPNGTLRDNVQRLLVERGDRSAVAPLQSLVMRARHPAAQVQALGALDGLGAIDADVLIKALGDRHPGVLRHAVRLSEPLLDGDASLRKAVEALAGDSWASVRFQVALSLGESTRTSAGRALGRIVARDAGDPWIRAAVLSSASNHAAAILEAEIAISAKEEPPAELVDMLLATLTGVRNQAATTRAVLAITHPGPEPATSLWRMSATAELLETAGDPTLATSDAVRPMIASTRALVSDVKADSRTRIVATRLLGRVPEQLEEDRTLLSNLLNVSSPADLQLAAVRALARLDDERAARSILANYETLGPMVRAAALDSLLARPRSTNVLLGAMEAKTVDLGSIDATHRQQIRSTGERGKEIFGGQPIGPRRAVLAAYAGVKVLTGDPARGKAVFNRACAACHKFGGQGHEVGPDIAALTDTSFDALMTAILDPNREVDARYASYSAALKDGRVLSGLIASETASAITLKRQEGQSDVILRADLEELKTGGRSLMPEGLENDLMPPDLADLIAYVGSGAARPKTLAGNKPALVVQGKGGVVRLPASSAEIYGPTLTFETQFHNLGMWQSADDHAAWTFQLEKPGTFTVTMEWACPEESAGNTLRLSFDQDVSQTVIGATGEGTWSNYRSIFVDEVTLPAGKHRLDARAVGPVKNAVLDLRGFTLTPRGEGVYRK